MGITKKTTRREQSAKIKPSRLRRTVAKLLAVYSNLTESERRSFDNLLLQHAFLLNGTNSYVEWGEWNEFDRRTSYFRLESVSHSVANAWFDWALEISVGNPSPASCREAILDLVGDLVGLNYLEEPIP
jgi:hypothetical protein